MYVYAQASAASVASFRACASGTGGSLGRLCVCICRKMRRGREVVREVCT